MIAIVDYGIGNIGSIMNMFKKIGVEEIVFTSDPDKLYKADKLVLPGVGAFDRGMSHLQDSGLVEFLQEIATVQKKPFLGICLGMQLMTNGSEEGKLPGLGLVDGETLAFKSRLEETFKVPHMGWSDVMVKKENPILSTNNSYRFYFVHSYFVRCSREEDILMETNYGITFTSAFQKDNLFGAQFHPEKSHRFGMEFLKKFSEI